MLVHIYQQVLHINCHGWSCDANADFTLALTLCLPGIFIHLHRLTQDLTKA